MRYAEGRWRRKWEVKRDRERRNRRERKWKGVQKNEVCGRKLEMNEGRSRGMERVEMEEVETGKQIVKEWKERGKEREEEAGNVALESTTKEPIGKEGSLGGRIGRRREAENEEQKIKNG